MMSAQHSINIIGWEISLSFGLITKNRAKIQTRTEQKKNISPFLKNSSKWVSLGDVLIQKALEGVYVRIVVWRHNMISYLTRLLYLGEVTVEAEVEKFRSKCQS
jgi:hypothetical protein